MKQRYQKLYSATLKMELVDSEFSLIFLNLRFYISATGG